MLNILAQTFRIATRTDDPRGYRDRDAPPRFRPLAEEDKWFWQGRRWGPPAGR